MKPLEEITGVYELDEDCELPPRLTQMFVSTAPDQMRELAHACKRKEIAAAREQAHKLKGGLYVVGASRLAEQLESLRSALERGDWDAAETLLRSSEAEFGRVIEALAKRSGGA